MNEIKKRYNHDLGNMNDLSLQWINSAGRFVLYSIVFPVDTIVHIFHNFLLNSFIKKDWLKE